MNYTTEEVAQMFGKSRRWIEKLCERFGIDRVGAAPRGVYRITDRGIWDLQVYFNSARPGRPRKTDA